MAYAGYVVALAVQPHSNADNLALGTALGNQVVVGKGTESGTLGVFFPTDGKLSPEMLAANDLLPRKDEFGVKIGGGFFPENGRVKSQKFRGERSDGFFAELSMLSWTGADLSQLKVGDEITVLNGKEVCSKYETPATLKAKAQNRGLTSNRRQTIHFKVHQETAQFRLAVAGIDPGSLVYITEKIHGTSFRVGNVLDEVKVEPKWWQFWRKPTTRMEYTLLVGSKNVILNRAGALTYYGGDKFRHEFAARVKPLLYKGETLYGEHAGFTDTGAMIMEAHDTDSTKDKSVGKQYGKKMRYLYGAEEGQTLSFIYRITMTNEDGVTIDLSEAQMRKRCLELGVPFVPVLATPIVYNGNEEELRAHVEALTVGPSSLDARHIREGVVLRVEAPQGNIYFIKNKSFLFGVMEGYAKEAEDYVDAEEVA